MKYINADKIFPEEILCEIQKYVQGAIIYIPKTKQAFKKWGECSGGKEYILNRNIQIRSAFEQGRKISEIADEFFLSVESIKKIVYCKKPD